MQRLASIYFDVPAFRSGTMGAYIFAFLCAGAATALLVGVQFITFFPAVIITTEPRRCRGLLPMLRLLSSAS